MTITEGSVVRARAGREKDSFFVVVKIEGDYAYIADGRRRKVETLKKKKFIHLQATNTIVDISMVTNRKIREALRSFTEATL